MNIVGRWISLPEQYRYIIVGSAGLFLGWIIYNVIFWLNPLQENRATTSWAVGYFLAIIRQHALHFFLTFSESNTSYLSSLIGAFGAYGIGWIITTIVNGIIMLKIQPNHQVAFFATAGIGFVFNYFLLKNLAFRSEV
jgi:putative flippase GtrA